MSDESRRTPWDRHHGLGRRGCRRVSAVGALFMLSTMLAPAVHAVEVEAERFLGREFWIADLQPSSQRTELHITNPSATLLQVAIHRQSSGLTLSRPVAPHSVLVEVLPDVIPSGSLWCFPLPDPCGKITLATSSSSPLITVTSVSADAPLFAVAVLKPRPLNDDGEMWQAIPKCELGTTHFAGNYGPASVPFVGVLATEPSTVVTIFDDSPTPTTVSTVTLSAAGDFYLWRGLDFGSAPGDGDLTGYRIVTSSPAAVYSGVNCTYLPGPWLACNALVEAVLPSRVLSGTGWIYPVVPTSVRPFGGSPPCTLAACPPCTGSSCTPDLFRFVASAPLRLLTSPPIPSCHDQLLDQGAFAECYSNEPFIAWSVDGTSGLTPGPDFWAYQYTVGQDTIFSPPAPVPVIPPALPPVQSPGIGDPSMVAIKPVNAFGCEATVSLPAGYDGHAYCVHVIRPVAGSLEIDDVPVPGTCSPYAGTMTNVLGIEYCTQHVCLDRSLRSVFRLESTGGPMQVYATAFAPYDAYFWSVPAHEADDASPYLAHCAGGGSVSCVSQIPVPSAGDVTTSFRCGPTGLLTPDGGALTVTIATTNDGHSGCAGDPRTVTHAYTVTDRCGHAATCSRQFVVEDAVGPTLSGVPPDASVECDQVPPPPPVTAVDACDGARDVVFSESRADGSCQGEYVLTRTWRAVDACGNATTATQVLSVTDDTPPVVVPAPGQAHEACLKQANHKYFCYESLSAKWSVTDACGCVAGVTVSCTSSEPENDTGDGNTVEDCVYDEVNDVLCVRAERKGNHKGADNDRPGRVYTAHVIATDCCGNTGVPVEVFRVYVPHDSRMNPLDSLGNPLPCEKPIGPSCCQVGSP